MERNRTLFSKSVNTQYMFAVEKRVEIKPVTYRPGELK